MAHRVLMADQAHWRPSNQMGVLNSDLGRQLGAESLGARFWRLAPGQASTRHRHAMSHELYVVLEGTGRMRVGDHDALTLPAHSAVIVEPDDVRQVFNDTDQECLWLVVGAPTEPANSLEMSADTLAFIYPDGPNALPPELGGGGASSAQ